MLPLTLLSFTGQQQGEDVKLVWTTAEEIDLLRFELERSSDGVSYTSISKITPRGGLTASYQYIDHPDKMHSIYYRLKMIDRDGDYTFSNIVTIKKPSSGITLELYPNPAKGFVIANHAAFNNDAHIQLIDQSGRIIKQLQVRKNTLQTKIDLTGLLDGLYRIVLKDGLHTYTQSILKN